MATVAAIGMLALSGPAAAGETGLVKAALAHGDLNTFVGLVARADLTGTLGAGPVTVFMPTDAAFTRLTSSQRATIAALSPDGVRSFVQSFVFPGTAMASNDIDQTITAQDGTSYVVTWYRGRLSLRDHHGPAEGSLAYVVGGDIPAGAGVVDAIDTVLLPASFGAPTTAAGAPAPDVAAVPSDMGRSPPTGPQAVAAKPAPIPEGTPDPKPSGMMAEAAGPAGAGTFDPPLPAAPAPPAAPLRPSTFSTDPAATTGPTAGLIAVAPSRPEADVAAASLRGWPLKISSGSTGRVDGVMVGLPDGHVTGLTAHFGGFLGFGGRDVFVAWGRVTPDSAAHVLRARMTAQEFTLAPARPPKP